MVEQWALGVAVRSLLLLAYCLLISRWQRHHPGFLSRFWVFVTAGLFVILLPLPSIGLPILSRSKDPWPTPKVYDLGFDPLSVKSVHEAPAHWPLWLLGGAVFVGTCLFALRIARTISLVRRGEQCTDRETLEKMYEVGERLSLREPLLLLYSDEIRTPCLAGAVNTVLLWPRRMEIDLTDEQARIVIAHELSHVERRDGLRMWLTDALSVVYGWNPLYWMYRDRLRTSIETACDHKVIRTFGVDPARYAELLLALREDPSAVERLRFGQIGALAERLRAMRAPKANQWADLLLLPILGFVLPLQISDRYPGAQDPMRISPYEVVFSSERHGTTSLYRMWDDGSSQRKLNRRFDGAALASVSRDGRTIAYVRHTKDRNDDVYVANVDGTKERVVVSTTGRDTEPHLSPDARKVLFISLTAKGWRTGIVDLTRGGIAWVPWQGGLYEAAWHPAGTRILASTDRSGVQKIWTMDVGGGNPRQMTQGMHVDGGASYSADGRYLFTCTIDPSDCNVVRLDLMTGESLRLTDDISSESEARSTPDGRFVFFTSGRTGTPSIVRMRMDGTDQRIVAQEGTCYWAAVPGS